MRSGMKIVADRAGFRLHRLVHHPPLERFTIMAGKTEVVVNADGFERCLSSAVACLALTFGKWRMIFGIEQLVSRPAMGVVTTVAAIGTGQDPFMLGPQFIRLHRVAA